MICQKCGCQNNYDAKFCVRCGYQFGFNEPGMNPGYGIHPENGNNAVSSNSSQATSMSLGRYLQVLIQAVLRPEVTFSKNEQAFESLKNSVIFSALLSVGMSLLMLLQTMYQTVRVTSYYKKQVKWVWSNLENIDYLKVIGKNFLFYFGIILLLATFYYLGSKILKKEANFSKLLGISAISCVCFFACMGILAPVSALLYTPLQTALTLVGGASLVLTISRVVTHEFAWENESAVIHLGCVSLWIIVSYCVYIKFFVGSLLSIF